MVISCVCGAIVACIAVFVMLGYLANHPAWITWGLNGPVMRFNTALFALFCGVGIVAIGMGRPVVTRIAGTLVFLGGALTALQTPLQIDFGIDELFFKNHFTEVPLAGARMAVNSAICYVLIGAALIIIGSKLFRNWQLFASAVLASAAFAIALVANLGHATGLTEAHGWGGSYGMAVPTALCFSLSGVWLTLLSMRHVHGSVVRWYPVIVGNAIIIGTIVLWHALEYHDSRRVLRLVETQFDSFQGRLTTNLSHVDHAIKRMGDRWTAANRMPINEWSTDANNYINDIEPLKVIIWLDSNMKVERQVYSGDYQYDYQKMLAEHPELVEKVVTARNTGQSALLHLCSANKNSKHNKKRDEVWICMPVLRKGRDDGCLLSAIDINQLVGNTIKSSLLEGQVISVSEGDNTIYSNANVNEELNAALAQSANIQFVNVTWKLDDIPWQSWVIKQRNILPELTLFGGIVLAALLSAVMQLAITARQNYRRVVKTTEMLTVEVEERSRSQTQLREALAFQRAILDSTTRCIVSTTPDAEIIIFNKAAERMLGYTAEEIIGKQTPAIWHDMQEVIERAKILSVELNRKVAPGFEVFVAKPMLGVPEEREWTYIRKDGTRFPVLQTFTAVQDQYGVVTGFVGVSNDISVQKKTEKDLQIAEAMARQENAKLSAMISGMEEGVVFADADNTISEANEYFCRFVGKQRGDLIGKRLEDLHKSDVQQKVLERLDDFKNNIGSSPYVVQRSLGQAEVIMRVQPVYRDGRYDGVLLNVIDVTELVTARHDAEAATHAKSDFLASMSHEIRTPLNAVIGLTGMLLDTEMNAEQRDFANTIRSSGEILLVLINDILDYSKIEAAKMELEKQPFDIRPCVEDALDLVEPKAAGKRLSMAFQMTEKLPRYFLGDVTRLQQIIVNLLGNAVKFTEEGSVTISLSGEPLDDENYRLHFVVKDTGIGIPPEAREKLFQSFTQVDASTSRRFGGTGLGLAISRKLCELMGGEMWVESSGVPGEGAAFHFTILAPMASEMDIRQESISPSALTGKHILIVDDTQINRDIFMHQVKHFSMQPVAASSGKEALEILGRGDPFDLALLDLRMPEMDGVELAREIRRLHPDRKMPLVLISSSWELPTESAADLFAVRLSKPVKESRLRDALCAALGEGIVADNNPLKNGSPYDVELGIRCPLRILLAEDNQVNQKVAHKMLAKFGYRADMVANGLEAVEAVAHVSYDVILMDCQMPEVDGYEATRRIRNLQQGEHLRPIWIIAMTAHALQGDREKCLNAGMDDYLMKPVRPAELRQALERCRPDEISDKLTTVVTKNEEKPESRENQPMKYEENTKVEITDATENCTATLNEESLRDIAEGDPEGTIELIDLYLEQADETMASLRTAIDSGLAEQINQLSHRLAGASMTCGAMAIVPALRELERRGLENELDGADSLLVQLLDQLETTRREMRSYIAGLQTQT